MRKLTLILTFISTLFLQEAYAQVSFYQDVFYGGVTGDGFSPWIMDNPGTFDVNIEPGSTIRKAYLFSTFWTSESLLLDQFDPRPLIFNGTPVVFDFGSPIASEWNSYKKVDKLVKVYQAASFL